MISWDHFAISAQMQDDYVGGKLLLSTIGIDELIGNQLF
jgi:hypothetical protein